MRTQAPRATGPARIPMGLSALLGLVRQRRRRNRNLAELGALDGARLYDIGLSEQGRDEILCPGATQR